MMEKPTLTTCCLIDLLTGTRIIIVLDLIQLLVQAVLVAAIGYHWAKLVAAGAMGASAIAALCHLEQGRTGLLRFYAYFRLSVIIVGVSTQLLIINLVSVKVDQLEQNRMLFYSIFVVLWTKEGGFFLLLQMSQLFRFLCGVTTVYTEVLVDVLFLSVLGFYTVLVVYSAAVKIENSNEVYRYRELDDRDYRAAVSYAQSSLRAVASQKSSGPKSSPREAPARGDDLSLNS